jgi:hypothetical protein
VLAGVVLAREEEDRVKGWCGPEGVARAEPIEIGYALWVLFVAEILRGRGVMEVCG